MTKLDPFTIKLLANTEVLAVNQASANNRQLSRQGDLIVWASDVPGSHDRYVAFFNAQSKEAAPDLSQANYKSPVLRGVGSVVEMSVPIGKARKLMLFVSDAGDGFAYDHSVWVEPVLCGPKGTLKLTNLRWRFASSGWGEPRVNRTCDNQPLLVNGTAVEGIGTHAVSVIVFDLPEGYDMFRARGALTQKGTVEFAVLADPVEKTIPDRSPVAVSFADLGISGKAQVRDLWKKEELGAFTNSFSREIPLHGAGLYRVSPVTTGRCHHRSITARFLPHPRILVRHLVHRSCVASNEGWEFRRSRGAAVAIRLCSGEYARGCQIDRDGQHRDRFPVEVQWVPLTQNRAYFRFTSR
jgi:hypothetical protein